MDSVIDALIIRIFYSENLTFGKPLEPVGDQTAELLTSDCVMGVGMNLCLFNLPNFC